MMRYLFVTIELLLLKNSFRTMFRSIVHAYSRTMQKLGQLGASGKMKHILRSKLAKKSYMLKSKKITALPILLMELVGCT
jgi:hypothetical protein